MKTIEAVDKTGVISQWFPRLVWAWPHGGPVGAFGSRQLHTCFKAVPLPLKHAPAAFWQWPVFHLLQMSGVGGNFFLPCWRCMD
jgi:hypothetical protein